MIVILFVILILIACFWRLTGEYIKSKILGLFSKWIIIGKLQLYILNITFTIIQVPFSLHDINFL